MTSNPEERLLQLFTVDAFTNKPFSGNPAAVCPLEQPLNDDVRQKIAAEMNISETAFLEKLDDELGYQNGKRFKLRWFTPTTEVPLCGHATLASAAVLFQHFKNSNQTIAFETLSGKLFTRKDGDYICMDLPLYSTVAQPENDMSAVVKATVGSLPVKELRMNPDMKKLLVRLDDRVSRKQLESITPNVAAMTSAQDGSKVRGVMVTLRGCEQNGAVDGTGQLYDFITRYFAPWVGIPEDPVTGSAHAVLAGYWSNELDKKQLYARQCSKRGGDLHISVREDGRVDMSGKATIVMEGQFTFTL
ncbi:phenazine biosynthesis-like domain-containing protein [Glandiceps talaboti]